MQPFHRHHGVLVPLLATNIDTDQIIPARFIHRPRNAGYGDQLFHDLRYDGSSAARSGFVLNQSGYRNGSILVAGLNFGCGSSREHAVWALLDYGFRAVIAPSFGDIFFNNALNNGLLTIVADDVLHEALALAARSKTGATVEVDLVDRTVVLDSRQSFAFDIDDHRQQALLEGASEIEMTLKALDRIRTFEVSHFDDKPWAAPK